MFFTALFPSLLLLSGTALAAGGPKFPAFSGNYAVGTVEFPLTDESRDDPMATGSPRKRKLMVQLFYPTTSDALSKFSVAPIGPAASLKLLETAMKAPEGSFGSVDTGVALGAPINYSPASSSAQSRVKRGQAGCEPAYSGNGGSSGSLPLVLFDPGLNGIRMAYGHIAANLASNGYIVAAVDHPFDAFFLEYPDGEIVTVNPKFDTSNPEFAADFLRNAGRVQDIRIPDMSFILETLLSDNFTVPGLNAKLNVDTSKLAMFGHSLGGSNSVALMMENQNIKCGIDMDGTLFGVVNDKPMDVKRPLMMMVADGHNSTEDKSLPTFYDTQKTVKPVTVHLLDTMHLAYSDLPILSDMLSLNRSDLGVFNPGNISGEKANSIINAYVEAFFDKHLKGKDSALLEKSPFPEAVVIDRA